MQSLSSPFRGAVGPTKWRGNKITGIDFASDWVWLDDDPLLALLWQIYPRCFSSLIQDRQYGHR